MGNFSKLNINREQFESDLRTNISSFFNESATYTFKDVGRSKQLSIHSDNTEYKISVFYSNNGTTTFLAIGSPVTHDRSNSFIQYVINNNTVSDKKNFSFSVRTLSDDAFNTLIDILINDLKSSKIEDISEFSYRLIKIKSQKDDVLTIKRYSNGNTQFQGKPLFLYLHLCEFLVELCSCEDIIKAQQECYEIDINKTAIEREYEARLASSYTYLGETLKNTILPAFSIANVQIELSDYTLFVFPVLKGLEGYIRKLFKDNGIITDKSRNKLGNFFKPSDVDPDVYVVNPVTCSIIISNTKLCDSLGKLYSFLRNERNSSFHIDGEIDTSRLIETRTEADDIFNKALDLIESTYIDMNK